MSFIKLDRKIEDWEWFTDANTLKLWIYLLVNAQYKDANYKGIEIKRGQLVTGRKKLAEKLEMSEQQIRTCLDHLQSTNEITIKPTNKFSVITIVKYAFYQDEFDCNNQQINQQNNQPSTNNQPTNNHNKRNKEGEEGKETKKDLNAEGRKPFVKPSLEEVKAYCIANGYEDIDAERFVNYYDRNDWTVKDKSGRRKKMSNWKLCLNSWVVNEIRFNKTNDLRNRSREAYIKDVNRKLEMDKRKDEPLFK